jgi:hypothetical protein
MPSDSPANSTPHDHQTQPEAPAEDPMLYCPVCNARLEERRCKLLCRRCGYYMSCADYY